MALRPVYSTQFIFGSGLDSYTYVCPAGYVALVTCIDTYVGLTTGSGNFTAALYNPALPRTAKFWSQGYTLPGEENARWRGKIVLTEGERLVVSAEDVHDCCASGDLLTLP